MHLRVLSEVFSYERLAEWMALNVKYIENQINLMSLKRYEVDSSLNVRIQVFTPHEM